MFNKTSNKYVLNLIISLLFIMSYALMPASHAGTVPGFDSKISIKVVEQPIDEFLRELFGQINMPAIIDPKVEGKISGTYNERTAEDVFNEVSGSFGLTVYFDGSVVYIYTANDLSQKILALPSKMVASVIRSANDLNMIDSKNFLQSARGGGLVVSGTKRFIDQVEELASATKMNVQEYKSPLSFRVFYLKYAWAQDVTFNFSGSKIVVPGVANILRFLVHDGATATTLPNQVRTEELERSVQSLRGQGLAAQPNQNEYLGLGANAQFPSVNGGVIPPSSLGDVRIGVDPRLNAVIVRDSPERMRYYESLIEALDVEPQMVEVEATIIDIRTSRLEELGINWRGITEDVDFLFGRGNASDLRLNPGVNSTPSGQGGFFNFVLGNTDQFLGRINALEAEGAAKIVSSPHVLTLSNVEAIFDTSETFFVRVAGEEEVDLFDVSVGTSLRVTPHVFMDNNVEKLKVLVAIDDGQQEKQTVDDIPVVTRSTINTQALLNIGESVLVGGLVREETSDEKTKVPLLGSLPLLGNLFKYKSNRNERVERMFLISPRISSKKKVEDRDSTFPEKEDNISNRDHYFSVKKPLTLRYPKVAKKRGIEGHCLVSYTILKKGKTTDVRAIECTHDEFKRASISAVKKMRFYARFRESDMIDVVDARQKIRFTLGEG